MIAAVGVAIAFVTGRVGAVEASSPADRTDDDQAAERSTLRWQIALGAVAVG